MKPMYINGKFTNGHATEKKLECDFLILRQQCNSLFQISNRIIKQRSES